MKTLCYCIGCKKHPLHDMRNTKNARWIHSHPYMPEDLAMGKEVECLEIDSRAFSEGYILDEPDTFEWDEVVYGDGQAMTEANPNPALTIRAVCGNEDHED